VSLAARWCQAAEATPISRSDECIHLSATPHLSAFRMARRLNYSAGDQAARRLLCAVPRQVEHAFSTSNSIVWLPAQFEQRIDSAPFGVLPHAHGTIARAVTRPIPRHWRKSLDES
jgi:hypothetical protein